MAIADRTCDGCGAFVPWRDAKIIGDRYLCPGCANGHAPAAPQPPKETDVAFKCSESGCTRPGFKKIKKLDRVLCFRHTRELAPQDLPASHRPVKTVSPAAPKAAPPRKPDGALHCRTCGQDLPKRVQKAVQVLLRNGVEDLDVAIKAATLVLQVSRPVTRS